ncbi:MAG: IS3 family transposase [Actinomycetota bacterium]|nr:IS3 family transposase [Actinomycetota bacterium]
MSVRPFIEAERAEQAGSVKRACELLEVSRAAYYDSRHTRSRRQVADEELGSRIQAIYDHSRGTYGWPRVRQALRREGICTSGKRVARLMRQRGLIGRCRRRWTKTTVSAPEADAVDLVRRAFGPDTVELDRTYVGDITYIWTWEGWLYLAAVIDLASRRVVGWAMADHLRAELACDALRMAIDARRPGPGAIFHSDRGTQYTARQFTDLLAEHEMVQSLSRPRQCWDNAVAEAWFATLKLELIDRQSWATRAQARRAIFEFIEVFYNRHRLHSTLDYLTPVEYEAMKIHHHQAAQAA